jgi:uncharacterized delta-60 repeat protein
VSLFLSALRRRCALPARSYAAAMLTAAILLPTALATPGQPGTLDATWATSSPLGAGKTMTPIGNSGIAFAVALQPDGKVLLAGGCSNGTNPDFCALRYLANGTIDSAFGVAGKVLTSIGNGDDVAFGLALQSDAKVVLAGTCFNGANSEFCALRYLADGTLDATFGVGGKATTTIIGSSIALTLTLQPDGKILLAGWCTTPSFGVFCALRYQADGTLDATFGIGGKVTTAIASGDNIATAIALQPDGKIVLAGYCGNAPNQDFCAIRYHPNGALDTSFGTGGKVTTAIGIGEDQANAIALQPDGKVLLAGACVNGPNKVFCALRYRADGTLDTSWSGDGKLMAFIGGDDNIVRAIALQPDGKVLLAGDCHSGSNVDFCAARHHADGTRDANFGTNGNVTTAIGSGVDQVGGIALQPDGKVLLAGACANASSASFCALRYDGGPFGYKACSLDIDGDGSLLATVDGLISTRVMLGMSGSAVVGGINFAPHATRTSWAAIREYLTTQCGMTIQ